MEEIKSIKERISHASLMIGRIPKKSKSQFINLAKDSCDDYGMTLKFLLDFYNGLIPSGIEHLEIEVEELREQIATLELKVNEKEEKKVKTRCDGSKR